jgi:hypothetical protein
MTQQENMADTHLDSASRRGGGCVYQDDQIDINIIDNCTLPVTLISARDKTRRAYFLLGLALVNATFGIEFFNSSGK